VAYNWLNLQAHGNQGPVHEEMSQFLLSYKMQGKDDYLLGQFRISITGRNIRTLTVFAFQILSNQKIPIYHVTVPLK
jgi:hypothetical protein